VDRHDRERCVGRAADDCSVVPRIERGPVAGTNQQARAGIERDRAAGMRAHGVEGDEVTTGELQEDPGVAGLGDR
jgi:hypothetical protein